MRKNVREVKGIGVPHTVVFFLFTLSILLQASRVSGNDVVTLAGTFESFACVAVCGTCCGSNIFLLERNDGFRATVGSSDVDLTQYVNDGVYYKVSGYFYRGTGSCDVGACDYFHVATVREMLSEDALFQYSYSVSAGTTVSFKVDLDGEGPIGSRYYAFYIRSGYGTPSYEEQQWQQIQPASTSSTCEYTFDTAGHYVVICHIKENENAEGFESVGFSVSVE